MVTSRAVVGSSAIRMSGWLLSLRADAARLPKKEVPSFQCDQRRFQATLLSRTTRSYKLEHRQPPQDSPFPLTTTTMSDIEEDAVLAGRGEEDENEEEEEHQESRQKQRKPRDRDEHEEEDEEEDEDEDEDEEDEDEDEDEGVERGKKRAKVRHSACHILV